MAKSGTFIISRPELRRILIAFGIPGKSIETILASMEKQHRHMNAIAMVALLERSGLNRDQTVNLFRRLGVDDVTIHEVLDESDEQRIMADTGRLFNVAIDFG